MEELCEGGFDFLEVEVEHEVLAGGERDLGELGVELAGMEVEDAWVMVGGVAPERVAKKSCREDAGVEAAGGGDAEGSEGEGVEGELPEFALARLGWIVVVGVVGG